MNYAAIGLVVLGLILLIGFHEPIRERNDERARVRPVRSTPIAPPDSCVPTRTAASWQRYESSIDRDAGYVCPAVITRTLCSCVAGRCEIERDR